MGAPEFAVPSLRALHAAGHDIAAVLSKPPSRSGRRGLEMAKSPVHRCADALSIRVLTPSSLRDLAALEELRAAAADVFVVAAYGMLLPPAALAIPKLVCLNVHASLLPRWRGAAPIQRAIMAGDLETGVCIMRMEAGLDTGPTCQRESVAIFPSSTAGGLGEELAAVGAKLIVRALEALAQGPLEFRAQDAALANYARKIDKAETAIDWNLDAGSVRNHIHGLSPFPGAHAAIAARTGLERIKCLRAEIAPGRGQPGEVLDERLTVACGHGALRILVAQRAGKSAMDGEALQRGAQIVPGARFRGAGP